MIADVPSQLLSNIGLQKPKGRVAPKQRLKSATDAAAIVSLILYADRDRAVVLARTKGMLDGNSPFDNAELVRQGQANRTNVNFREGEATLSMAETPYYDLFAEASTYCQIEVNEPDSQKRTQYSRVITGYFDEMLKDWSGFDWNMQRMIHDMVGFGRGFCLWSDPISWQFSAIQQSRVLVPDGTPSDPDQLEIVIVRQSVQVCDLYKKVRDPEAATKMGWDTDSVYSAIAGAAPERRNDLATLDYERIQEEIRNHDLLESVRSDVIRLAHLYVREFSGKVSHYIVEESRSLNWNPKESKKGTEPTFLYKKVGCYNCFRAALATFFFDIGDGTWHSVKGLAIKLYPFIEIKNRLNCSIVDNAFINMSVLLRPIAGRAEQETALMQIGPMTIMPSNMEVQQWGIAGRMEEGLAIERSLSDRLESNIGQYRKPLVREQGNPDTATKVNFDAMKEASLGKGAVNRFYTQLDHLFEQIFIRASNPNLIPENNSIGPNAAAIKFQKKCIDAGVPQKLLLDFKYVRASRNSGNGSVFLRQQVVQSTSQLVPMMNEAGKQNWLDDSISVMAGSENVDRWNPKQMLDTNLENQQAYAVIENDVLRDGSPVVVTSTQNNFVHGITHLKAASDAVNSIQQGGNPMQVIAFLESVGPHIAEHLQRLSGDPSRGKEFKAMSAQLKQLGKITDQMHQQMQQAQQKQQAQMQAQQQQMAVQQQRTQQVMSDEQLKQYETGNKIQISRQKAASNQELRKQVHDQNLRLKEENARLDMTVKDATAATSIRTQTAKTAADIANQTRKTSATKES